MTRRTDVLIVGASVSGLTTAEALRRNGFDGKITLLGAEPYLPYDRPPLSKQILSGAWRPERTLLRPPRMLADLNLELLLGQPALGLDVATRTVHTAVGPVRADTVVIATGATPRRLPAPPGLRGVHVLRTLDDALALRDDLAKSWTVVVVGEGVLGAEIAATTRQSGHEVTMTGLLHAPMATQLGDLAAERLADLHTANGVRLRLGVGVSGLADREGEPTGAPHRGEEANLPGRGHEVTGLPDHGGEITGLSDRVGTVTGVCLASGETLPADLVVVAIGAVPVTDWLAGSGLTLDRGVVCDAECRAAEGIYAVGDVARWRDPGTNATTRLENRTHAAEQAGVVAANILGAARPYRPIPYFWTDQYTTKIQVHGTITPDAEAVVVDGDPATDRFVIRYERAGSVTAVLGWNMPKQARMQRQHLVDAHTTPVHAP